MLITFIFSSLSVLMTLLLLFAPSCRVLAASNNHQQFLPRNVSAKLQGITGVADFDSIDPSQIPASVPSDSIIRDRANYLFVLSSTMANCQINAFDTRTNEYSTSLVNTEVYPGVGQDEVAFCHAITVSVVNGSFVVRVFGELNNIMSMSTDQFTIAFDANLKALDAVPDTQEVAGGAVVSFAFSNKFGFPSSAKQYFFILSQPTFQSSSAKLRIHEMPWPTGKAWTSGDEVTIPDSIDVGYHPILCGRNGLAFDKERSIVADSAKNSINETQQVFVFYVPLLSIQGFSSVARLTVKRNVSINNNNHNNNAAPSLSVQRVNLTPYLHPNPLVSVPELNMVGVIIDQRNSVLLVVLGNENLFKLTLTDEGIVEPSGAGNNITVGTFGSSVFPANRGLFAVSTMLILPEIVDQSMFLIAQDLTPVRLFDLDYSGSKTMEQKYISIVNDSSSSSSIESSRGNVAGMVHHGSGDASIFAVCDEGKIIRFSREEQPSSTTTFAATTTSSAMVTSTTTPSTTSTTLPPERKTASRTVSITETSTTTMTTSESTSLSISSTRTETTTSSSSVMPAPTPTSNTSTSTTTTTTTIPSIPSSVTSTETPLSSSTTTTATSLPTTSSTNPTTTTTTSTESTSISSSTLSALVPSTTTSSTPTETTSPSSHHGNNHNSSKNDNNDKGSKAKTTEIAGGVAAGVVFLVLAGFFLYRMNRNKQRTTNTFDDNESQVGDRLIQNSDGYQDYGTV